MEYASRSEIDDDDEDDDGIVKALLVEEMQRAKAEQAGRRLVRRRANLMVNGQDVFFFVGCKRSAVHHSNFQKKDFEINVKNGFRLWYQRRGVTGLNGLFLSARWKVYEARCLATVKILNVGSYKRWIGRSYTLDVSRTKIKAYC